MTTTYLLEHRGLNGRPEVCKEQKELFKAKGIPFTPLNWPTGDGSGFSAGEEIIEETQSAFDFSSLDRPSIVLNGHGKLHGRTYFFVSGIKKDLSYYQLDAHGDSAFVNEGELGCENHIHQTMQLDHVRKVNLIGLNPLNLTDDLGYYHGADYDGCFVFAPSPAMTRRSTVELFLAEPWEAAMERVKQSDSPFFEDGEYYPYNILEEQGKRFLVYREPNFSNDPTPHAYVSIDLDVIKGFPSGWPRAGLWTAEKVIDTINQIGKNKKIIGADICGLSLDRTDERPLSNDRKQNALETIVRIHQTLLDNMDSD